MLFKHLAGLGLLRCRPPFSSSRLSSISLSLLHLLERSHRAVQRVLVVAAELGVCAFQGGVSEGLGLLDSVGELGLVNSFGGRRNRILRRGS